MTASAITRKWLIEKRLGHVGKDLAAAAKLRALDSANHVSCIEKDGRFIFYCSGGAALDGRPLNSFYHHISGANDDGSARLPIPKLKNYTLSKFLARRCAYFRGYWITTEDVIRYVANKTGGVHYDTRRDKHREQVIDAARKHFLLGNSPDLQPEDHSGPFVYNPYLPSGLWDFSQIEMLAVAQTLCNVRFGGERFLRYRNLDNRDPAGDFEDDILLGIRNVGIEEEPDSANDQWLIPSNMSNPTNR
ncbi:MAG: hypothetical protein V2I65_07060 [Paracoccaceae bacterium]|nr:hypothetical protein [Paracoccaceae bacterium]